MIFNAGVSSYTSENVLNCFESVFKMISKREVWKEKETMIVFAFGINDSAEYIGSKNKRVELEQFEKNVHCLVDLCKNEKLIQQVIFVSATNVDENIINQMDNQWAEHFFYNKEIEEYNAVIKSSADFNNLAYIDVFGILENLDLDDGLHPNSKWHKKIYEKVLEFIES